MTRAPAGDDAGKPTLQPEDEASGIKSGMRISSTSFVLFRSLSSVATRASRSEMRDACWRRCFSICCIRLNSRGLSGVDKVLSFQVQIVERQMGDGRAGVVDDVLRLAMGAVAISPDVEARPGRDAVDEPVACPFDLCPAVGIIGVSRQVDDRVSGTEGVREEKSSHLAASSGEHVGEGDAVSAAFLHLDGIQTKLGLHDRKKVIAAPDFWLRFGIQRQ